MAEKERVTQGEDLIITPEDLVNSEWGGLLTARQKIFPTEKRIIILSRWIQEAYVDLYDKTGRTEAWFIADSDRKTRSETTLKKMVGVKILQRAQNARIDITETDYTRQIRDLIADIEEDILNFEDPSVSPVKVEHVESDLVDPDEDYSYNV